MSSISNDWLEPLSPEFKKEYYRKLYEKVKEEYATQVVFPPSDEIFSAFLLTPLKDVKVVIIGQDPYHNIGQAHGLCFSVKPEVAIPPSLVNIYKELHDDLVVRLIFCAIVLSLSLRHRLRFAVTELSFPVVRFLRDLRLLPTVHALT